MCRLIGLRGARLPRAAIRRQFRTDCRWSGCHVGQTLVKGLYVNSGMRGQPGKADCGINVITQQLLAECRLARKIAFESLAKKPLSKCRVAFGSRLNCFSEIPCQSHSHSPSFCSFFLFLYTFYHSKEGEGCRRRGLAHGPWPASTHAQMTSCIETQVCATRLFRPGHEERDEGERWCLSPSSPLRLSPFMGQDRCPPSWCWD